jgi:hypothetical protein
VFGGLAEVGVRLDDYYRRGIPLAHRPDINVDLKLLDSIGPRGRPYGRYQDYHLNSAGFRSSEASLTPKPGCVRVMTLGSSETFGAGTEGVGYDYPAQLQDSLAKHGCFQVINGAILGMSMPSMITMWNAYGSRFAPDIVVILPNQMVYLGDPPPSFPKPRPDPAPSWKSALYPRLADRFKEVANYPAFIQRQRDDNFIAEETAGRPATWYYPEPPKDRLAQYRRDLDSLITAVQARGAQVVLTPCPMKFGDKLETRADSALMTAWRLYMPRAKPEVALPFMLMANDVLRDVGRERGVPVVDLAAALNGRGELFYDFSHFTRSGASLIAAKLADTVVSVSARSAPGQRERRQYEHFESTRIISSVIPRAFRKSSIAWRQFVHRSSP